MKNKSGIGIWLLSLCLCLSLVPPPQSGHAQGVEPPPGTLTAVSISRYIFVDVNGNLPFNPVTNATCDNGMYLPGYTVGAAPQAELAVQAGKLIPQDIELIVYIPDLVNGGKVTFTIDRANSSRWPGVCNNLFHGDTKKGNAEWFDFVFLNPTNPKDEVLEVKDRPFNGDKTCRVKLRCRDFGGRVRVNFVFDNVRQQVPGGPIIVVPSPAPLNIPFDVDNDGTGNWISNMWEGRVQIASGGALTIDEDTQRCPTRLHRGDGFSLLEEYRGFVQMDVHRRSDELQIVGGTPPPLLPPAGPVYQQIMLVDEVQYAGNTKAWELESCQLADHLGFTFHLFGPGEVNPQGGSHAGLVDFTMKNVSGHWPQRCIRVIVRNNIEGWGEAPVGFQDDTVKLRLVDTSSPGIASSAQQWWVPVQSLVASVLVHEIGHVLRIPHPPDRIRIIGEPSWTSPNYDIWWLEPSNGSGPPGNRTAWAWVPVAVAPSGAIGILEKPSDGAGNADPAWVVSTALENGYLGNMTVHGVGHEARIMRIVLAAWSFTPGGNPKYPIVKPVVYLPFTRHSGSLSDAMQDPSGIFPNPTTFYQAEVMNARIR